MSEVSTAMGNWQAVDSSVSRLVGFEDKRYQHAHHSHKANASEIHIVKVPVTMTANTVTASRDAFLLKITTVGHRDNIDFT